MASVHRILIIDDHPLYREGLKSIIARDAKFVVVGESGSARQGRLKARQLQPDVAVVDISLPDRSGIELTRDIRSVSPRTRILIVSMHLKIDYIVESFKAGATGYVVKESAAERLLKGLSAVAQGEYFLDSSISCQVVEKLMQGPGRAAKITDRGYDALTPREQEVMRALAQGAATKEVADRLCISPKTVDNHRANIMRKLGIHSAFELVRYAARLGLIDLDQWKD